MNPQASLDAPRWQWTEGKTILFESGTMVDIIEGLAARGHEVQVQPASGGFGRGQIIWRLPDGGYMAGSDLRADGAAVGF
jgi:gamma-glutamyltranspeptidase/glutathione hydrolase